MSEWWNRQNTAPGQHNPFVSWSNMPASQPFRLPPPPQPHLFPYPSYPYPPGMYFHQQNNYINANYPPPNMPYPQTHHQPPVTAPPLPSQNAKKPPMTIIIDQDSAIVISDSEEEVVAEPREEKKKVKPVSQKAEAKEEKGEKEEKKEATVQETRRRLEKESLEVPVNLQPRRCKAADLLRRYLDGREEKPKTKVVKKRSERFVYRMKPHQKELMRLSGCREAMPGQLMTGPYFQARIPVFRRGGVGRWLKLRREGLMQRLQ